MSCSVVLSRYRFDDITTYFHYWSEEIIKFAEEKSIPLFDLSGDNANKKNVRSYINKQRPTILFVNGHGNQESVLGHNNEPIVDLSSKFKVNVIYARSCDAAVQLAEVLIKNGTEAFIGYERKFTLCWLGKYNTRPLQDPIAKHFLEPSNLVVTTLMKGHTVQEAHNRSREAANKNLKRMLSSESTDDERYAARWLWGNIRNQSVKGNPLAKAV